MGFPERIDTMARMYEEQIKLKMDIQSSESRAV